MKNLFTLFTLLTLSFFLSNKAQAQHCAGQPVAGFISITGMDTICTGQTALLSLNGNTGDSGITYQWEMMDNGFWMWMNGGGDDSSVTFTPMPLMNITWYR